MPRTHGRSTEVRLEAVKRHGDSPTYAYDGHRRQGENQTPGLPRGSALAPFRLSETTRLGATAAMKPRSPSEQKRKKKALPGDRKKRGRGASAVAKRRAEVLAVTRKMPRDLTAIPLNAGRERSGTGIDRCCHQPNHSLRSLHVGKAIRSSWIAG